MVTDTKSASGFEDICGKKRNETMCWREAVRQMDAQQKSSKTGMNRNTGVDLR